MEYLNLQTYFFLLKVPSTQTKQIHGFRNTNANSANINRCRKILGFRRRGRVSVNFYANPKKFGLDSKALQT